MNKHRRILLQGTAGLGLLTGAGILLRAQTIGDDAMTDADTDLDQTVADTTGNWQQFAPAGANLPAVSDTLELDDTVWRERLTADAYRVLRKEGTERAFTSTLLNEKQRGLYLCAGCELPLFTSAMKFDSGTGWPSFTTMIDGHIETRRDYRLFLPRTEYHCSRCGGHQGHVFDDGPAPTGQRWCNNGVALTFLAAG
ncbi:MAG: peptide-methionine (R)-S-oxide reductase MsrB [Gammaproteobacteria bacterium]|jgi:peptide-methionine (R)-S-oxide reductase|nr:peptide-methionine (R)-S-oxide reductase MsrB [Gammaproteobacteria bacterium]